MAASKEVISANRMEATADISMQPRQTEVAGVPNEIRGWLHQVESMQQNTNVQINDQYGNPVLQPTTAGMTGKPKTVAVSKRNFVAGFKKKVGDAGRWLSVFILRMIKMKKGNIAFKEEANE